MKQFSRLLLVLAFMALSCCTREAIHTSDKAMRETSAPVLADDLPLEGLISGIESEVAYRSRHPAKELHFGPLVLPEQSYLESLKALAQYARNSASKEDVLHYIQEHFRFFEVYGQNEWSDVFITGYFEPEIRGATQQSQEFSRALYRAPHDLLKLNLSRFDEQFASTRPLRARLDGNSVVPYFNRSEIDNGGALAGRNLEICWTDPIDAFFLQVQGSGIVIMPDGKELHLVYAEKNGWRYEGIAKFLKEALGENIPTMQSIEAYLRGLQPSAAQEVLNKNPSYVFFETSEREAVTALNVPATAGRTIATDQAFFPKGALAFLEFPKPVANGAPEPVSRLVLDQDIGGAITGPGRVDLFFGRGADAKFSAGRMQAHGKLYYLVPR